MAAVSTVDLFRLGHLSVFFLILEASLVEVVHVLWCAIIPALFGLRIERSRNIFGNRKESLEELWDGIN